MPCRPPPPGSPSLLYLSIVPRLSMAYRHNHPFERNADFVLRYVPLGRPLGLGPRHRLAGVPQRLQRVPRLQIRPRAVRRRQVARAQQVDPPAAPAGRQLAPRLLLPPEQRLR
eukprot:1194279-Prorocentrum_minimum.AAC.9